MPTFDLALFAPLLAAHLLSDFVLQSNAMAQTKGRPSTLFLHLLITALCAYLLLGDFSEWRIPALLAASHGVIDLLKNWLSPKYVPDLPAFIADQFAHIAVILTLSAFDWTKLGLFEPWWFDHNPETYLQVMIVATGAIANTLAAGHLIGKALPTMLARDPAELHKDNGLNKAGRYIGYLERLLLLISVYSGQLAAAGFLIAAKSVLRFQKSNESRREAEYILVGTLLSFTIGIAFAVATKQLLNSV